MINQGHAGLEHRYSYSATPVPGWFLFNGIVKHDNQTGHETRYDLPEGVYASETAVAPKTNSASEDDAYLITITSDMNQDLSECLVFDAANLADGPIARVRLPERVSSGTHSTWARGSQIPNWFSDHGLDAALDRIPSPSA
jgi:carotenoid cleavage dioxygenase